MALTGRAALLALAGVLAAVLLRSAAGLVAADGLILAAIAADLVLAASVRRLDLSRSGDARILLGQAGSSELTIGNPGQRPLRAVIRDAWQPSLAAPGPARVVVPPGGQVTISTVLAPTRRGDKQAGQVTVRSLG